MSTGCNVYGGNYPAAWMYNVYSAGPSLFLTPFPHSEPGRPPTAQPYPTYSPSTTSPKIAIPATIMMLSTTQRALKRALERAPEKALERESVDRTVR